MVNTNTVVLGFRGVENTGICCVFCSESLQEHENTSYVAFLTTKRMRKKLCSHMVARCTEATPPIAPPPPPSPPTTNTNTNTNNTNNTNNNTNNTTTTNNNNKKQSKRATFCATTTSLGASLVCEALQWSISMLPDINGDKNNSQLVGLLSLLFDLPRQLDLQLLAISQRRYLDIASQTKEWFCRSSFASGIQTSLPCVRTVVPL